MLSFTYYPFTRSVKSRLLPLHLPLRPWLTGPPAAAGGPARLRGTSDSPPPPPPGEPGETPPPRPPPNTSAGDRRTPPYPATSQTMPFTVTRMRHGLFTVTRMRRVALGAPARAGSVTWRGLAVPTGTAGFQPAPAPAAGARRGVPDQDGCDGLPAGSRRSQWDDRPVPRRSQCAAWQREPLNPALCRGSGGSHLPRFPRRGRRGRKEERRGRKEERRGRKEERRGRKEERRGRKEERRGRKEERRGRKEERRGRKEERRGRKEERRGDRRSAGLRPYCYTSASAGVRA